MLTVFDTRSSKRSKLETRQSHKCSFDSSLCLAGKVLKNRPHELNGKSRPWERRVSAGLHFNSSEIVLTKLFNILQVGRGRRKEETSVNGSTSIRLNLNCSINNITRGYM